MALVLWECHTGLEGKGHAAEEAGEARICSGQDTRVILTEWGKLVSPLVAHC